MTTTRQHTTSTTAPAAWLRTVLTPHTALVIDYRSGAFSLLDGNARQVWCARVDGRHPTSLDRCTVDSMVADFTSRGWLVPACTPATPPRVVHLDDPAVSWGTQETAAVLALGAWTPWRWRLAALPAVALVLIARQCGHRGGRFARLLRLTRLGARLPMATEPQARHAVRAVRRAARIVPARVACLEESVAATVLLAAVGRHARWCHGIATDPVRLHAWIADRNGDPVEEPANTNRYTLIN